MNDSEENSNHKESNIIIQKMNIPKDISSDLEKSINNDTDIIKNINKIFLNNSQYNNKEKDYFMNRFQIIEILKKSNIIAKGIISRTQVDIILTKLNPYKRKFNLNDFQNFLTELCHYIYKDEFKNAPKKTMNYFLNCLFSNYNDYLEEKNSNNFLEKKDDNSCTIKCIEMIITSNLEKPICKLLLTLYDSFKKIYKVYFQNELTKNINANKELIVLTSSENLYQFSKDFEIVPYIINKTNLNIYFNFLIKYQIENPEITYNIMSCGEKKYKDVGIFFKLSSFILFIYHYSIFLYYKDFKTQFIEDINNNKYETSDDVDKIVFFLQKLENSSGINQYLRKKGRTNENKFTFIPTNKNIEIANEEMKQEKNNIAAIKEYKKNIVKSMNKNKNYKDENYGTSYTPYTSRIVTERKNDNCCIKTLSPHKSLSEIKNNNFSEYFKERIKKENDYLPLSELRKILSVSSSIKDDIINNIEYLSEIFLKYSKIYDKLEYNRMTISSFIQFLKDTNILYCVPDEQKNNYRKLSDKLIKKNYNISEVKTFDQSLKCCVSSSNLNLSNEEKKYRKNIDQIVNSNNTSKGKISLVEASLIFFSLTNYNNFPSNTNKIRTQFDKNTGYKNINMNSYMEKVLSFDTKRENFIQKNIPNKMNLILFIKSFELIATKLYPEMTLDDAVLNLLNYKILIFIKVKGIKLINSEVMNTALEKMNNDVTIKQFLFDFGNIIYPLYTLYSDKNGKMKFYQLFDFYKNFQLFPELISLSQMKAVFFILCESSSVNEDNNNNKNKNSIEEIDFSLFLQSLVISSMLFNFKDIISDIDRLLYICYIIWKSDNIKKQKVGENIPQKINRSFIELLKKYNKNINNDEEMILTKKKTKNKFGINRSCSNPNFSGKKLVLTYNNDDKEYICTMANRDIYKFGDIYN